MVSMNLKEVYEAIMACEARMAGLSVEARLFPGDDDWQAKILDSEMHLRHLLDKLWKERETYSERARESRESGNYLSEENLDSYIKSKSDLPE